MKKTEIKKKERNEKETKNKECTRERKMYGR